MAILILTESELRQCAPMDEAALGAVESAFTWLAEDKVAMPSIMHRSAPSASLVPGRRRVTSYRVCVWCGTSGACW